MSLNHRVKVFQLLAGGPWGGGAVVVLSITQRLIQEGCQVWALCLSDEVSQRFSEAGAQVFTPRHWQREINPVVDLLAFFEIYRFIKKNRFDIVHTHTSKGGILGRIAARLAGVPTVIHTVHGFAFHEFSGKLAKTIFMNLEKFAALFCDYIICVNNEDRLTAIEKGIVKPEKIVTIMNGINLKQFEGNFNPKLLKEEFNLPPEAIVIGTVGRLAPQKGNEYLIRAIPDVLETNPQTWVLFAGDGPIEAGLKALANELGVLDHCIFMGFRRDIPQFLTNCDIIVLPSLREGLSISLLEAMAAGKATIATNIRGNREVVTDGVDGILCQPQSSQALADGMINLISSREKARLMGERARRTMESHFDEKIMQDRTIDIYRQLGNHSIRSQEQKSQIEPLGN